MEGTGSLVNNVRSKRAYYSLAIFEKVYISYWGILFRSVNDENMKTA